MGGLQFEQSQAVKLANFVISGVTCRIADDRNVLAGRGKPSNCVMFTSLHIDAVSCFPTGMHPQVEPRYQVKGCCEDTALSPGIYSHFSV